MRFHIFFSSLCLLLWSCGGGSSGQINVSTTSTLSEAEADQVAQFVFVVATPNSSGSVLYPSGCLSTCASNESGCPNSGICLSNEVCGFAADEPLFDPNISFSDFAQDETLSVRLCGLTQNGQIITSGSGQVSNSDGASVSITLSSSNECGGLPSVCP